MCGILRTALVRLQQQFEHTEYWELYENVVDNLKHPLQLLKDIKKGIGTDFFQDASLNASSRSIMLLGILI